MKLAVGFDFLNFSCPAFGFFDFEEGGRKAGVMMDLCCRAFFRAQSQPERIRSSAEGRISRCAENETVGSPSTTAAPTFGMTTLDERPIRKTAPLPSARLIPQALQPRVK